MGAVIYFIMIIIVISMISSKKQERQKAERRQQNAAKMQTAQSYTRPEQESTPDILKRAMTNVKEATNHQTQNQSRNQKSYQKANTYPNGNQKGYQYHNPAEDEENCEMVESIFDQDRPVLIKDSDHLTAAHKAYEAEMEWADGTALMDEVQNLITCGYDGTLSFGRDFVAEGIEMLNNMEYQANA